MKEKKTLESEINQSKKKKGAYQWECKMVQQLWKPVWRFFKKLKIELPQNPAIPFLGIYLKEQKAGSQRHICTSVLTTALLIITKVEATQMSMDRWMKKMQYIYHMTEYYLALKRKKILTHAASVRT